MAELTRREFIVQTAAGAAGIVGGAVLIPARGVTRSRMSMTEYLAVVRPFRCDWRVKGTAKPTGEICDARTGMGLPLRAYKIDEGAGTCEHWVTDANGSIRVFRQSDGSLGARGVKVSGGYVFRPMCWCPLCLTAKRLTEFRLVPPLSKHGFIFPCLECEASSS
jgi:hypothetical protein